MYWQLFWKGVFLPVSGNIADFLRTCNVYALPVSPSWSPAQCVELCPCRSLFLRFGMLRVIAPWILLQGSGWMSPSFKMPIELPSLFFPFCSHPTRADHFLCRQMLMLVNFQASLLLTRCPLNYFLVPCSWRGPFWVDGQLLMEGRVNATSVFAS